MKALKLAATNEIKIDKNIPMPERFGSRVTYPFAQLEVGDSFEYVPAGSSKGGVYTSVAHANLKHAPKKFVGKMSKGNCRIWRIA